METKAYAKINLTLEVLGRRSDGYHEVRTVLQTIDLADTLHFTLAPELEIECTEPVLGVEDNLAWKAGDSLRKATGCGKGARVLLGKHIPVGMGLGGGSSDAAATLKALNSLWELGLDDARLQSIGASLGADVPFFLRGGTALGEGRGDVIRDLPPISQSWVVLLCPALPHAGPGDPLASKTARLYSMMTPERYTGGGYTRGLMDTLEGGGFSQELLFNVFEPLAPVAFHGFDQSRQAFLEAGAKRVCLSGSGPALYSFVSCKEEGERLSESLKRKGFRAYCVSTIAPDAPLSPG